MNTILFVLLIIDVAGTLAGMCAMQVMSLSCRIGALSGGVMLGAVFFWIWPDLTKSAGLEHSLLTVAVGVTALYTVDRFVYPVCPCCDHGHRFRAGGGALLPLLAAICLHNLFDGWTTGMAHSAGSTIRSGLAIGLLAHKIPEAVIFGMMLRSASRTRKALLFSAFASGASILAGGLIHIWMPLGSAVVLSFSLAAACASFLFAGFHTFERQWEHGGFRSAFAALSFGVAGTLAMERGISLAIGLF